MSVFKGSPKVHGIVTIYFLQNNNNYIYNAKKCVDILIKYYNVLNS